MSKCHFFLSPVRLMTFISPVSFFITMSFMVSPDMSMSNVRFIPVLVLILSIPPVCSVVNENSSPPQLRCILNISSKASPNVALFAFGIGLPLMMDAAVRD